MNVRGTFLLKSDSYVRWAQLSSLQTRNNIEDQLVTEPVTRV